MEIFEIQSRPSKTFEKCSLFELRTRTGEQFGDRGRFACLLLNVAASRKVRDGSAVTSLGWRSDVTRFDRRPAAAPNVPNE